MYYDNLPSLETVKELIRPSIEEHYDVFLQKYIDLVNEDEYGELDTDDFVREMTRFIKKYSMYDYSFRRETWEAIGGIGYIVFREIAKEKGDSCRDFTCPEANNFCVRFVEDQYELVMKIWQQNVQKDFNGEFYYEAIEEKFRELLSPGLINLYPMYRDKHWHNAWEYLLATFTDKVEELDDKRFYEELACDSTYTYDEDTIPDGVAYENYVKKLLEDAGYEVETTPITGDQGVDLIAKKNYLSIAIQCKHWQSHVGNSAVQEVFAGSKYYGTAYRAVVTNSGYTAAAEELASHLRVLLLTDENLIEKIEPLFEIN